MTPNYSAFYLVFSLLGASLVAWGLIQRFRGSAPECGSSPEAIDQDHAEGLAAMCSGLLMLLTVALFHYFITG
ncbi:MAG: hypothetical protein LCH89_16820 [Proteobacteria bacterium]|jgi:hypothetical protein|nr:hypothetical protein [Pseudomonadota bacterium]